MRGFSFQRERRKERSKEMKRFKTIDKNHWWITTHENPSDKAGVFIPLALARKEGDFSRVRGVVWAWFRRELWENGSLGECEAYYVGGVRAVEI